MTEQHATLVYDSAGVVSFSDGSSARAQERGLLFTTSDLAIDIVIRAVPGDLLSVRGQVLNDRAEVPIVDASVRLGGLDGIVRTDERGRFAIRTTGPIASRTLSVEAGTASVSCSFPPVE